MNASLSVNTLAATDLHGQLRNLCADYPLYKQEHVEDKLVVAKLFNIAGGGTWWITGYDPDGRVVTGYVTGMAYDEWGYASINELAELRWNGIPRIEVDLYFKQARFSEIDFVTGQVKASDGSEGLVAGENGEVIPLTDFIEEFGASLLDAVREQNPPVYRGEANPARDAVMDGLLRKPFVPQRELVHAVTRLLVDEDDPAAVINAEMGTGKTIMAIAAAAVMHREGFGRTLVISPPHLVYKWRREIRETVPDARVWILNGPDTLKKLLQLRAMVQKPTVPEFFIMGRVRMRMGFNWRPAFVAKRALLEMPMGGKVVMTYATCPTCGDFIKDEENCPLPAELAKTRLDQERTSCKSCGERLWTLMARGKAPKSTRDLLNEALRKIPTIGGKTADRLLSTFGEEMLSGMLGDNVHEFINLMNEEGELFFSDRQAKRMERAMANMEFSFGQGGYQPTEFIKRYLPQGYFGLLVVDEGHEYKNEGSAQGQAMGVLARKCRKTILLTGTLMGGYADDLFYLLHRLDPRQMIGDGFAYNARRSLGGASMAFMREHGVLIDVFKDTNDGSHRTAKGSKQSHRTKKGPGFGPKGIMRYVVPITAFLKLRDIGANVLPPYREHFVGESMREDQAAAYLRLSMTLKEILGKALVCGDTTLLGVVLNVLLAWPDCAFRDELVRHPRTGAQLAYVPAVLKPGEAGPKEEKLLEICRAEKARGRRVLVYSVYTGTRDTTARLKAQLDQAGFKVAVLRASVDASKREDWLFEQVDRGVDVIITNPELVKTGLDMLEFPTIVFMQSGYNVYTLQQAARRSWRIGQKQEVDVYFLGYEGSAQMACLELMAKKIAVAQSTSGDMPESGLDVLNQGGESIEVALARQLVG
jgi:hypothetical protein